jgi:hypothetical protein
MASRRVKAQIGVLLAGAVILGAVFVQSHPDFVAHPPRSSREACGLFFDPANCQAAATFAAINAKQPIRQIVLPSIPDPARTPGAINPAINQDNIAATICKGDYQAEKSPPPSWKAAATRRLVESLYPSENPDDFSLDYLVPISLGGAVADPRNLWLQTWTGPDRELKNHLEMLLTKMVCNGQIALAVAQQRIAGDWRDTYQRAMTPKNLAQYQMPLKWAVSPEQFPPFTSPNVRPIEGERAQVAGEPLILQAELVDPEPYEVPAIPTEPLYPQQ